MILIKAIIMAGGEGTRLRPLTSTIPKPMLPLLNKPVMEYIIELLKKHNITEIGVTLAYLPKVIEDYFGDGKEFGVNLHYFTEDKPLGTAGSVKNAASFIDEDFIIISGDGLCDFDLTRAIRFHSKKDALATIVTTNVPEPLSYGVIISDDSGKITRFLEKPSWSEVFSDTVNTGIYILKKEVLDYIPENQFYDFSKDLFPKIKSEGLYSYNAEGYWCDIGSIDSYVSCQQDILAKKADVAIKYQPDVNGNYIGKNTIIAGNVQLTPPVFIGDNCLIKNGVRLGANTVIGDNASIGDFTSVKQSILFHNVIVGRLSALRKSIISNQCTIRDGASLFEDSVIGTGCVIGERSFVSPKVKIWPYKTVEKDSRANSNIVWNNAAQKTLFSERGIFGEYNIDITPQFAANLGSAYGTVFKNSDVGVFSDFSPVSDSLLQCFSAALQVCGSTVYYASSMTLPAARQAVKHYGLAGAVYISCRSKEFDQCISIDFLDHQGCDIRRSVEKKIEDCYFKEDFARVGIDSVQPCKRINDFLERYVKNIARYNNKNYHEFNIYIDTPSKFIYNICDYLLSGFVKLVKRGVPSVIGEQDICVLIDHKGELLSIYDKAGKRIDTNSYSAVVSMIALQNKSTRHIYIPTSCPESMSDFVEQNGGTAFVCKNACSEIMNAMAQNNDFELFDYYYDGIFALVKILNFLSERDMSLYDLLNQTPDFHIVRREISCPSEKKGKIIGELAKRFTDEKTELSDGVKIYKENGWSLIVPDMKRSLLHITTSADNTEFARELTDFFESEIKKI